jgi:hypothetical protein
MNDQSRYACSLDLSPVLVRRAEQLDFSSAVSSWLKGSPLEPDWPGRQPLDFGSVCRPSLMTALSQENDDEQ